MEKYRIFVADDDKSFLELMEDLLQEEGYAVVKLSSPEAAFREIVDAHPDVIILDLILERREVGWLLLQELKRDPRTMHTPVIVCSADAPSLRAKQDHLREMGTPSLEKPCDVDDILSAVEQALTPKPKGDTPE